MKRGDQMKSLSVKLRVILIGLIIFGYAEAWGANWKLFATNATGRFYYDAESITRPSKGVVIVWEKIVFTEKGVIDVVGDLGEKFKTLNHLRNLSEFHCADKNFRVLSTVMYSTHGITLESYNYQEPKWNPIIPESVYDILYNILCK